MKMKPKTIFSSFLAAIIFLPAIANATNSVDPRIAVNFARAFHHPSIYLENKCQDNIARFLSLLEKARVPVEALYALEITNPGFDNFGMVGAQTTRTYPANWFHHVVLYDGNYIYDFDFTKVPTPVTPPEYFHQMFKTEAHKKNPISCNKGLGAYQLTFRPAFLYLRMYLGRKVAPTYNKPVITKRVREIAGWGCDSNLN